MSRAAADDGTDGATASGTIPKCSSRDSGGQDFSQFGEQAEILAWADGFAVPGSFCDVGAYDGLTFSNTRALALRGWGGLLIDPAPDAARQCAFLYADRGDVDVSCVAVARVAGAAQLLWTPGAPYSSLLPGALEGRTITTRCVDAASVALAMQGRPRPWFLSLDCEGATLELLPQLLELLAPDAVCVEAHEYLPDERAVAVAHLQGWRKLDSNPVNVLYSRC